MTIAPPRRTIPLPDADVLIEEARQHQHRRHLTVVVAATAAVVIGIVAYLIAGGSGSEHHVGLVAPKPPDGLAIANPVAFHNEGDLAFVSQGRLFVLNGKTNSFKVVTAATTSASNPQFSSNGKWLTYSLDNGQVGLAHADGSQPRIVASSGQEQAQWLPDGELYLGTNIFSVSPTGTLTRTGSAPKGLIGWSADGKRYVFLTDSLKVNPPATSHGIERLEVANSLNGKRTLWYEAPTSFSAKGGIHGNVFENVTVLQNDEGLLLSNDPDHEDDADGMGLFELRAPGAALKQLAVTLQPDTGGTVSVATNGDFIVGAGGDRYAWAKKTVTLCNAVKESCKPVVLPSGMLSIDPAWSSSQDALAFVEAKVEPEASIGQDVVASWYKTHQLAVLRSGASTPTLISDTAGASTPEWSSDGKSLLYVSGDALWLIRSLGTKPIEIVSPLFSPGAWPSYYGEVNWTSQFAWSKA